MNAAFHFKVDLCSFSDGKCSDTLEVAYGNLFHPKALACMTYRFCHILGSVSSQSVAGFTLHAVLMSAVKISVPW